MSLGAWNGLALHLLGLILLCLTLQAYAACLAVAPSNNSPTDRNLTERPDKIWRDAVAKGKKICSLLQSGSYPDKQDPPTVQDLMDEGWNLFPRKPNPLPPYLLPVGLSTKLLRAIGASSGKDYYDEDLCFEGTVYDAIYSPKNGLIAAQYSNKLLPSHLHWSDGAFAVWQWACASTAAPLKSLKFIAQCAISNSITLRVLIDIEANFPRRPRTIEISPKNPKTSEWYYAIMGTPNAAGVAYMLLEHKAQLGFRMIPRIKLLLYGDGLDPGWSPDILFETDELQVANKTGSCESSLSKSAIIKSSVGNTSESCVFQ